MQLHFLDDRKVVCEAEVQVSNQKIGHGSLKYLDSKVAAVNDGSNNAAANRDAARVLESKQRYQNVSCKVGRAE
jgi:hypothetical protein